MYWPATIPLSRGGDRALNRCFKAEGFMVHPACFPTRVRRLWFWERPWFRADAALAGIGVLFHSDQYISPGEWIELSIPLRREIQKFTGRVVLVRVVPDGYEVGLLLANEADGARCRIVEQICQIESYLWQRRREGRSLHREQAAREWIDRYAAGFPGI